MHSMARPHFIYLSVDRRLGCFDFLTAVNNAAVDICV